MDITVHASATGVTTRISSWRRNAGPAITSESSLPETRSSCSVQGVLRPATKKRHAEEIKKEARIAVIAMWWRIPVS
jgi:hypothetical protein